MIQQNIRFIGPLGDGRDPDAARDEPSHIHIARPSLRRRDNPGSSVEATDYVRDLAATEVTVQAA